MQSLSHAPPGDQFFDEHDDLYVGIGTKVRHEFLVWRQRTLTKIFAQFFKIWERRASVVSKMAISLQHNWFVINQLGVHKKNESVVCILVVVSGCDRVIAPLSYTWIDASSSWRPNRVYSSACVGLY